MNKQSRKSAPRLVRFAPLFLGLMAVGCGGGGGAGSLGNVTGPTQKGNIGPIAVSYSGHPQAEINGSSNQVTAEGQAGASYTSLSMNPAPNLNSTFLLFTRYLSGSAYQIYTMSPYSSQTQALLVHTSSNAYPTISHSGVIAFEANPFGTPTLVTMKTDGSSERVLSVPGYAGGIPAISPNGQTITYQDSSGSVYTVPVGGGTPTKIYTGLGGSNDSPPVWSPTSNVIAFTDFRSGTSYWNTFTIASTGGATTNVTPLGYQDDEVLAQGWSPDGTTLACREYAPGASTANLMTINLAGGSDNILTQSGFSDNFGSFSPDGGRIAFYRYSTGGATPGIYISDVVGSNLQLMLEDPTTGASGPVESIAWSPFLESQTFVGAYGAITTSPVDGFLVAQCASQFASLLTFTATTPSTATISQSANNSNGAPMIYTLAADSINNVSYTNSYNGGHTSIPLTSTPLTLVSIDAITGQVDLVAPAVVGKAHSMATRSSGTATTYTGQFSAIYDGNGKNLAPSGATTLEIDKTTGKLISFK